MRSSTIFRTNFWILFFLIAFLNFIGMYCVSKILWSDHVYQESFTGGDFSEYISSVRSIDLYRYLLSPFYVLVKSFAIACAMYGGAILLNLRIEVVDILKIALVAELTFVISDIVKTIWFLFCVSKYYSSDIQEFAPLSIYDALGGVGEWLSYPLKTLNVYQILYGLVIWMGLKGIGLPKDKAFQLVCISYGMALFFWILFWTFIGVEFST